MITLKLQTHKIRIALGESANTELGCYAGFKEWGSGISNNNDLALILTTGVTPIDFVAPPSNVNVQRDIHTISIFNRDNIAHTITLYYNVNGNDYPLRSLTVPAGGSLDYGDSLGWSVTSPNPFGYAINVQALTSSPTDGQTVYFGTLPKAPVTVAATSKIYIRKAGTLKAAEIYCYSGTAGSAENWSLYVRKNNTTDYLISTLGVSASERIFSNTGLSIPLAVGDYIEIKGIQPAWGTNPATTIYGGYLYIE
jgi:hypothetical protein